MDNPNITLTVPVPDWMADTLAQYATLWRITPEDLLRRLVLGFVKDNAPDRIPEHYDPSDSESMINRFVSYLIIQGLDRGATEIRFTRDDNSAEEDGAVVTFVSDAGTEAGEAIPRAVTGLLFDRLLEMAFPLSTSPGDPAEQGSFVVKDKTVSVSRWHCGMCRRKIKGCTSPCVLPQSGFPNSRHSAP